ncbi:MAG: energy-coupling factor ABC transporter substrate-binding protein [Chamaesiphon sp.]|nr:energy-coupling factor ABC transporter substrate-binding protein [Chamaesiphon sp.]
MNQSSKTVQNWLLIGGVLVLAVVPLVFVKEGKFSGSDNKAKDAITEVQPNYKPWFSSPIVPASGEIESLLFASQAALGAGFVGYAIGLYKGRSEHK